MNEVELTINGRSARVPAGISVAAALLAAGIDHFRRSVGGEPRAPLCGMGICNECRVMIDGRPHQLGCEIIVRDGIEVTTDA